MNKYLLCLVFSLAFQPMFSQNITWATPAKLQVYAMNKDGEQLVMSSESLFVTYDQLKMAGELELNTFQTDADLFKNLLDSAGTEKITFSGILPEGKFAYQDVLNEHFIVETEFRYGDHISQIIINYEVSNRKTSLANTFDITVTGNLSLKDDLGVTRETGLEDRISFLFFQNVQTRNY